MYASWGGGGGSRKRSTSNKLSSCSMTRLINYMEIFHRSGRGRLDFKDELHLKQACKKDYEVREGGGASTGSFNIDTIYKHRCQAS